MSGEDLVIAEIKRLRSEVTALRGHVAMSGMRHGWLKHVIKNLETDPHTQYSVHFYGVIYWLINFPAVCYLFFFQPTLWLKWGIFITLIYSIYANFATDYGAMSAAMAAFGQGTLPELPVESHIPTASENASPK